MDKLSTAEGSFKSGAGEVGQEGPQASGPASLAEPVSSGCSDRSVSKMND